MNRIFVLFNFLLLTISAVAQSDAESKPTDTSVAISAEERRNKVAILPFTLLKDGEPAGIEASMEIQNECFTLFTKNKGLYTFLPTRRTDVLLNRAGITRNTIINYTMDELCKVLGVEYIVDGTVSQVKTSTSSYGNSNYSSKEKGDDNKKASGTSSTSTTNTQNYQTTLDFKIYNDQGETIYNQNRKAFWNTADAYKNALEYVVKRSPLYAK